MASYDTPGLTYDSGVLYADMPAPQPSKQMAKVKLDLQRKNVEQKLTQANNIKTSLTGNANFTTPNPTLAAYGALITGLTNKNASVKLLEGQLKAANADRDLAESALDAGTTQLGAYVENASAGDAVKIQSAGMEIRAGNASIGPLGQVMNLALTAGDNDGEVDVQWDPERGAKSYEVQINTDPNVPAGWRGVTPTSKSRTTLKGLASGTKIWVRVRAIGKGDPGPWSDPAVKTVP